MGEEPERLRADVQELARVLRSGMTGVYSWNGVKTMVGRKLDALDALLAEVERLAGEREQRLDASRSVGLPDEATLADLIRHHRNNAALAAALEGDVECERLAGRVATLEAALAEAADWLDEDLAHAPDTATAMADRSLVASWRETLAEESQ